MMTQRGGDTADTADVADVASRLTSDRRAFFFSWKARGRERGVRRASPRGHSNALRASPRRAKGRYVRPRVRSTTREAPIPSPAKMRDDEARYNPLRRDFSRRDAPDDDDDDDDLEDDDGAEEEEDEEEEELDLVAEAHRARLARLFHRRECETRARAELRALDAIRRARETRAALDVETESARARLEREHAFTWADDATVRAAERAAERAAASLGAAMDEEDAWERARRPSFGECRPRDREVAGSNPSGGATHRDVATWERHDVAWAAFEARAARAANGDDGAAARVDDVPWPPTRDPRDALSALAAIEAARARGGVRTGDISDARGVVAAAHRRAFRRLSLRWHPDKFHARFGAALRTDVEGGARDGLLEGETHADAIARRVRDVAQGVNDAWASFQARWGRT